MSAESAPTRRLVSWDQVKALAALAPQRGHDRPATTSPPVAPEELARRIRAYLARVPVAISGQHGHDATFRVARILVIEWDLSPDDAYPFLAEWNERCVPPWTERELRRKLSEANKLNRPRGRLLRREPAWSGVGIAPADGGRPVHVLTNYTVTEVQDGETMKAVKSARPCEDIFDDLMNVTGGWPKVCGKSLFVPDQLSPDGVTELESANSFFAWLDQMFGGDGRNGVKWGGRENPGPSQQVFFEYCKLNADRYSAYSSCPHEPSVPGYFYTNPPVETLESPGEALAGFLRLFSPATGDDEDLIRAMIYTTVWGGPPGKRPGFLITVPEGDGRGYGKTTLAVKVAKLVGGEIEMGQEEEIDQFKTRLLTPDTLGKRVILIDNVKSTKFSRAGLESLVTGETISGRQLFVGNGQRPNFFTTIITMNGATLSSDLAQRSVPILVRRPEFGTTWDEEADTYIATHRWAIIADVVHDLRQPGRPVTEPFRWGLWQREVLARAARDPDAITRLIVQRQGEANADQEESDLVEDAILAAVKESLLDDPQTGAVFISSRAMARLCGKALGQVRPVSHWTRIVAMMAIPRLRPYRSARARGWIWQGDEWRVTLDDDGCPRLWAARIDE